MCVCVSPTQEPQVSDMSPESRRLQAEMSVNDMSVEALLVQPHVQVRPSRHTHTHTHARTHMCSHEVTAPLNMHC